MALKTFDISLQSTHMLTPRVLHLNFVLADDGSFNFIPGQFVTFLWEKEGKTIRRSYSISTIPTKSDAIEIAVSPVKGGFATEKLFNLQPGDTLTCSGPFGRLLLPEQTPPHTWLIATGTGVSPYRAMLPAIAERLTQNPEAHVSLLLGVRHREDLLYAEDFIELAKQADRFHFYAHLSREKTLENGYEKNGYVLHGLEKLTPNPGTDLVYLCGNPDMIDDTFAMLQEQGFGPRSVKREKYISSR